MANKGKLGRPRIYDKPMVITSIRIPVDVHKWLKERGIAPTITELVREKMEEEASK